MTAAEAGATRGSDRTDHHPRQRSRRQRWKQRAGGYSLRRQRRESAAATWRERGYARSRETRSRVTQRRPLTLCDPQSQRGTSGGGGNGGTAEAVNGTAAGGNGSFGDTASGTAQGGGDGTKPVSMPSVHRPRRNWRCRRERSACRDPANVCLGTASRGGGVAATPTAPVSGAQAAERGLVRQPERCRQRRQRR